MAKLMIMTAEIQNQKEVDKPPTRPIGENNKYKAIMPLNIVELAAQP